MPVLSKPGSENPIVFGRNYDVARSDVTFSILSGTFLGLM